MKMPMQCDAVRVVRRRMINAAEELEIQFLADGEVLAFFISPSAVPDGGAFEIPIQLTLTLTID
jgi:hypothetical protein